MKYAIAAMLAIGGLALPQLALAEHVIVEAPIEHEFLAPIPSAAWEVTELPQPPQLTTPVGTPHKFPWGQCTFHVSTRRTITFSGHAKSWLTNGARAGYTTAAVPVPGAVVVTNESRRYGHVGYVERVDAAAQTFTFSEMNYAGLGVVTQRTMGFNDPRIRGFLL